MSQNADDTRIHRSAHSAPTDERTLPQILNEVAAAQPDTCFAGFPDEAPEKRTLSFAEVATQSAALAAALAPVLGAGQHLLVMLPTGPDFVVALFAAWRLGAAVAPYPAPSLSKDEDFERFAALLQPLLCDAKPALILVRGAELAEGLSRRLATPCVDLDTLSASELTAFEGRTGNADDVAVLQYTSGPVSAPKGVMLSHRNIIANIYGMGVQLELGPKDVGLSWLPLFQDMGLIGSLLLSLYWRFPSHFMKAESFLLRPHRYLALLSELKASITGAPSFGYKLCVKRVRDSQLQGVELSALRVALSGAETVDAEASRAFETRFAAWGLRKNVIIPAFGMAENALAASIAPPGRPLRTLQLDAKALAEGRIELSDCPDGCVEVVSLGAPLAGQSLAVMGADGELRAERELGELVLQGPSFMKGYLADEQPELRFRNGWGRSGDLAFFDQGELFLVGRIKRMVIKRGRNYYCADIEAVLRNELGARLREVVALALPNPEAASEDLALLLDFGDAPEPSAARADRDLSKQLDALLLGHLAIRAEHIFVLEGQPLPRETAEQVELARRCMGTEVAS
ncbi:MAG: AMP-binding protein [Myxococcota bacterium]|jgi:acyl-CoA synthetase (AMP-forming)/AMP-acid ligase II|nr:AMP-binding protein [Myxococcota bacterium]